MRGETRWPITQKCIKPHTLAPSSVGSNDAVNSSDVLEAILLHLADRLRVDGIGILLLPEEVEVENHVLTRELNSSGQHTPSGMDRYPPRDEAK